MSSGLKQRRDYLNNLIARIELYEIKCPECGSTDYKQVIFDSDVPEYQCNKCKTYFKDKIANSSPR